MGFFSNLFAKKTPAPIYEEVEIKVAGVTFKNGRKHRQTILRKIKFRDDEFANNCQVSIEQYDFEGEVALGVYVNGQQIGNIPRDKKEWLIENGDRIVGGFNLKVYGGDNGKSFGAIIKLKLKQNQETT
ncbi:MAG: hypothetical protein FWH20_00360 [Oscillospiraceae bacterium]|nr:hypothetical protein [Oscillospiraceae bacterium]